MIYCSHTQKSHQVAAQSSSVAGFLIPRRSFISISSQSWKVSLRIAVISCKDWSVGRRWGWLLNIYMLCVWVRKVVSCAGRLFEISIEISSWCSQQYFIFFSLRCCFVSVPHDMFQKLLVMVSFLCLTLSVPKPDALCFLVCGNWFSKCAVDELLNYFVDVSWSCIWLRALHLHLMLFDVAPRQCWSIVSCILMLYLFYSVDIHRCTLATPIYAWIHHLGS